MSDCLIETGITPRPTPENVLAEARITLCDLNVAFNEIINHVPTDAKMQRLITAVVKKLDQLEEDLEG
jgi:hypothetical protein